MKLLPGQCWRAMTALMVLVLVGCSVESSPGSGRRTHLEPQPNSGVYFPYFCPHEPTLYKLKVTQSEREYVQYVEYVTKVPHLTSFTINYWFNLADTNYTSTMFNYEFNPRRSENHLTVQLEAYDRGAQQYWVLYINGEIVSREAVHPALKSGTWHHALHSWDSNTGIVSHYIDGELFKIRQVYKTKGWLIPGGGVAVSAQHQSAIVLFGGMDQGKGLNGWLTLFHLSSKPIGSSSQATALAKLTSQCANDPEGDIISWNKTPRKGFGGVTETPSDSKACGRF